MLTMAEVRERVGWPEVDEETNAEYKLVYLLVRPTRAGRHSIDFGLEDDRSSIAHFGAWALAVTPRDYRRGD
jgi:hypothetical protein